MPQLGAPELLIILVIILFVFGAGKLPHVARDLARGIREFRTATESEAEVASFAGAALEKKGNPANRPDGMSGGESGPTT